ncbi:Atrial natriuretic peptide receptor 2 [Geodia barretti]|uniref:guanylate cyclase n=1 Tax=Geodia barretti TaxID=519541 RepID=A0AA35REM4_GEOBA|nr:Atrial natriuretic peptide receptor 2 [Geodia barretti]
MEWRRRPDKPEVTVGGTVHFAVNITSTDIQFNDDLAALCVRDCPAHCNVTPQDCCVWHATLLTCSLRPGDDFDLCVPWSERNVVRTETMCGPFGLYNASIVLSEPGFRIIIYHLQVGNVSIVLGDYINIRGAVCGDMMCHKAVEDCVSCPVDCCAVELGTVVSVAFLVVVITATIVTTLSVAGCVVYRKKKRIGDESWIINYSDITTNPKRAMSSLQSLNKRRGSTGGSLTSALDLQAQQVFAEIGAYEGKTVAIRRIRMKRCIFAGCGSISSQLRKEVFQIRYLEHQNLCKFIGATVKDPTPNIAIISEYCSKGSLNDVLLNDDVPLTWNFRFSFAGDIARGMAFLHSHGITHGRLTSSNCVIDDRWVTKVTDYGLPALRYGEESGEEEEEEAGEQLQRIVPKVYRAPEVRDLPPQKPSSSQPADVYSYAIILYEIATGMDPHSENTWQLDANFKPKINQGQLSNTKCPCSQDYLNVSPTSPSSRA